MNALVIAGRVSAKAAMVALSSSLVMHGTTGAGVGICNGVGAHNGVAELLATIFVN